MDKEQKFFDALKDVFVGAKVEGESGYINLMRIKFSYYENGVFPKLKKDIDKSLEPFPEFREELFDKLYTFFHRYFSKSGSIYFRYTPIHQNIYEKVYTDDKDVILFWKTHMLYYVKTDRLFKNLEVESDGFKFFFDVSTLQHKRANEKRAIVYDFKKIRDDGTIVFEVSYSERGRKTRIGKILRALKKEDIEINEEVLQKAFRVFEKQSEVDYFINKDAKEFLREQFNIWLYQYVFSGESEFSEKRVKQLQTLKDIAFKIIDFISQFEDELVKIWNKPKFVLNSNYVITLDRIADKNIELVKKILEHEDIEKQIKEWKDLEIIDANFDETNILESTLIGKELNKKSQFLPVDTKYFKDLEFEILGLFDNLDSELDGWLIKSENYQALNTILPKFKEEVQTIYIDPPFNKEQDADYFYSVKYKDSSWITLLENRLQLAKDVLEGIGSIFVNSDDNGNMYIRLLMEEIFGKNNFRNEIIWCYEKPGGPSHQLKNNHSNIYFFSKTDDYLFNVLFVPRKGETELTKRSGRFKTDYEGKISPDWWINIPSFATAMTAKERVKHNIGVEFITQQPEKILKRVIMLSSNESDLVMDFFLGSGTTTAVAHKLNRKWLGVEMGEHFYTVVLPRMKKVLAGDKSGISKAVDWQGGGFFKYYELEQYEDTLRRIKYEDSNLLEHSYRDPYNQYVFMRDSKMIEALEIDYENNQVEVDLSKLYENIDISETLSNILGKYIKRITFDFVEFEDGERIDIKNLDYNIIKPLIWW